MWKFLILVVGVLFPWWSDAQESKEPWFITDVAVGDAGQVILSCRGDKSLKITDPQGRQVVKTIPLQQTPTGVIAKEWAGGSWVDDEKPKDTLCYTTDAGRFRLQPTSSTR